MEILECLSHDFLGYVRVCKKWYAFFEMIKRQISPICEFYSLLSIYDSSHRFDRVNIFRRANKYEIQYTLDNRMLDPYIGMKDAARAGNKELLLLLAKRGGKSWAEYMCRATDDNNKEIIDVCIENGAVNYSEYLRIAKCHKFDDLCKFFEQKRMELNREKKRKCKERKLRLIRKIQAEHEIKPYNNVKKMTK